MCDSLVISFSVFHHWNWKARAHFHVLATLWDADKLSLPRCVQFPFEMQASQISLQDYCHLCIKTRDGCLHTKLLGSFPSCILSWQGSVQQFQQRRWPRCLQLGSPAHFSSVGCSSDWQASKASRKLGTWRDNSASLWSAACLEARPLLGEVIRLSQLDKMAIWD